LEKFKEPKVLPCQHTYCKRCLERLVTADGRGNYEVTCPECGRKTEVREKKIGMFLRFSTYKEMLSKLMYGI